MLFDYCHPVTCSCQPGLFRSYLLNFLYLPKLDWVRQYFFLSLTAPKAIKSSNLVVFVSYSIHWGKICRWEHKGTVSINISCWSFSLLSLWIKQLISCNGYCRQQQVILAEILLHTHERSGKHILSNVLKPHPNCSIASFTCGSTTHSFSHSGV